MSEIDFLASRLSQQLANYIHRDQMYGIFNDRPNKSQHLLAWNVESAL